MRWRALWSLRWHHQIAMDLRPIHLKDINSLTLHEILRIGPVAYDVLERIANQCLSVEWINIHIVKYLPDFAKLIDPWYPHPKPPIPDPEPRPIVSIYPTLFQNAVLGALVYMIGNQFQEATEDVKKKAEQIDEEKFAEKAIEMASKLIKESLRKSMTDIKEFESMLDNKK